MTSRTRLVSYIVAPPAITLVSHQFLYLASMQSCRHGANPLAHLIPATAIMVIALSIAAAHRDWRATEVEPAPAVRSAEKPTRRDVPVPHAHFLAMLGVTIGSFSSPVMTAQWLMLGIFGTCIVL